MCYTHQPVKSIGEDDIEPESMLGDGIHEQPQLTDATVHINGNQPLENDRARFAGTLRFSRGRSQPTVACFMGVNRVNSLNIQTI